MYEDDEMSHDIIGARLGVDCETIRKHCKRYGIIARSRDLAIHIGHQREKRGIRLSEQEMLVLDGLMLGDGHLAMGSGGRSARYSHGSKHRETLESIRHALASLEFSEPRAHESRRHGIPSTAFFFKSRAYSQLLPQRLRWYDDDVSERLRKRVPSDLRLTSDVLYWWFIGDGSICTYQLKLSTEGFTDGCRGGLRARLLELGIETNLTKSGCILVCARSVPTFYELMGDCRNPEYAYKWQYRKPRWTYRRGLRRTAA